MALLLAIFTLLLLTAMGLSLLCAADLETNIAANYRDKQVANYAALSGLQEARDRLIPTRCITPIGQTCNDGIAIDMRTLAVPTTSNNGVVYIINPANGETVAPWDSGNKYYDTELCSENYFKTTLNICSAPIPSALYGTVYDDSQSSAGEYQPVAGGALPVPLPYKWVRITVKADNMTPAGVQMYNSGTLSAASGLAVCWDGTYQVPISTTSGYDAQCRGIPALQLTYANGTLCPNNICNFDPPIGVNYTDDTNVQFSGGSGSGAAATATVQLTPGGQVTSVNVSPAGSGYSSAPTVTIACGTCTSQATAYATIGTGYPAMLDNGSNGTSNTFTQRTTDACYTSANPSVTIVSADGFGSGAKAAPVMTGLTCIASETLSISSGTCAQTGGQFTLNDSSHGGGSGFSTNVTINNAGTAITASSIQDPGTGYSAKKPPVLSGLTGCTISATYTLGYQMTNVNLVNGGSVVKDSGKGYQSNPIVQIAAPNAPAAGKAPTITAVTDTTSPGVTSVDSVVITNPGSGYNPSAPPAVTFTGGLPGTCTPSTCSSAQGTATVSDGTTGQLTQVALTQSGTYSSAPAVAIVDPGGGSGAASAVKAVVATKSSLGQVFLLTSMASTPAGSKTMSQMEVATPPARPLAMPGALTLDTPYDGDPIISASSSTNFNVNGNDGNTGHISNCSYTKQSAKAAIGVFDDPNNPTTPTAVACIQSDLGGAQVSQCPQQTNKTTNYTGSSGTTPDVQNVYSSLGDLTTPAGVDELATQIASQASYTYPDNPSTIHLGSYPNDCPTIVVQGDLSLNAQSGCGVLLVEGNLTLSGNYTWTGPIFVIGWGGSFNGGGGGNGTIQGSLFVAKDRNAPCGTSENSTACTGVTKGSADWLASSTLLAQLGNPSISYNVNGGGGNSILYNSCYSDAMLSNLHLSAPPSDSPLKILSTRSLF